MSPAAPLLRAQDIALVGGRVYPSPDARAVENAVVLVRGGKIVAVGSKSSIAMPPKIRVIDCKGKFIVAGFWNSHIHIFTPGLLKASAASANGLSDELDAMLNRWGFTTVFDIASVLDNTLALRRRIDAGEVGGPHILTVGEPLWTKAPVYVQEFIQENRIKIGEVHSPQEAAARVRDEAGRGADGVKLFTGSVQAGGVENMPLPIVRAAVAEAHRLKLPVFAHPQNTAGLENAIEGGVDILAHTAPNSPPWTKAFVRRLIMRGMALIPTLTLFDFEARKAKIGDQDRESWIDKMVAELRVFSENNGEVLFGTDVGYTDHYDTTMELQLMSRAGMDGRAILRSLTTNPALRFRSKSAGRVMAGYDGDLVVLDADPARDVANFAKVRYTIKGGRVIYRAK